MPTPIKIQVGGKELRGELNDSASAKVVIEHLPLTVGLSRWGDEYYGNCGLTIKTDATARELMEVGEIAIWPPGNALCLFFGPTPASTDARPRAASPVNPVGRITENAAQLKALGPSVTATLARLD